MNDRDIESVRIKIYSVWKIFVEALILPYDDDKDNTNVIERNSFANIKYSSFDLLSKIFYYELPSSERYLLFQSFTEKMHSTINRSCWFHELEVFGK